MKRAGAILVTALSGAILWATPACAQAQEYGNYATVRALEAGAHLQPAGDGQQQALVLNLPITEGDTVWTESRGRADLLMQDGSHLFLDGSTRIEVDQLPGENPRDARAMRVRLWKGILLLDVRNWTSSMSGYLVTTPSAALSPSRAGIYLLEVESVDRTRVTCAEGTCVVASAGESVTLDGRQMTYAEYGYPPMAPMGSGTLPAGLMGFREANTAERSGPSESQQYLPANLSVYSSDLDEGGDWSYEPTYGYVWRPSDVEPSWAPYTNGQWVYNSWGTTWVPYEPWGWAPFHYGRWIFSSGIGWGWCPMPYFAPAWVSFSWWGGSLGWCPLDYWGDPCWRPYGWYSCPVTNIYNTNINNVIVRHKEAPPPQPIYPRAQGSPASLRGGGPRGAGTLNLPPQAVRDYRDGRLSAADLQARAREPVATARRSYPSIQSGDRLRGSGGAVSSPSHRDGSDGGATRSGSTTRTEPQVGRGTAVSGTARQGGDPPSAREPRRPIAPPQGRDSGRVPPSSSEPRLPLSYPANRDGAGSSGNARQPSAPREAVRTQAGDRGDFSDYAPARQEPRRVPPNSGNARSGAATATRSQSSEPRRAPQASYSGSSAPRNIPSRPSIGSSSSGGSKASAPSPSRAPSPSPSRSPSPAPSSSGSSHKR